MSGLTDVEKDSIEHHVIEMLVNRFGESGQVDATRYAIEKLSEMLRSGEVWNDRGECICCGTPRWPDG